MFSFATKLILITVVEIKKKWLSQGKKTTLKELTFVEMNKSKQGAAILEKYIPGQRLPHEL
jgi:hypothetical protein